MKKIFLLFIILIGVIFVVGCEQTTSMGYTIKYYYEAIEDETYVLEEAKNFISSKEGEVTITPETKEGFTFNEHISVLTGQVTLNSKPTFFLYYDRNSYDVIFNVDGSLYESIEAKYGEIISIENPMKTGYQFTSWKIEQTATTFDMSNPIDGNYILNATFERTDEPLEDPYDYSGYYAGAKGLYEDELVSFLHQLLNTGFDGVTYGDARYMLDDTDQDLSNVDNVILVYLGTSVSGTWDAGATWNREHVWPQSFLGVDADNSTVNSASDLHNLKPSNPRENSSRGNKYFGNETNPQTYEPRDEVKGDIARILFYMDVMYTELSLIYADEGDIYEMGNLDVLLQWHIIDPVDDFERNRNELIYDYQNNRNPFIDHPEFVEKIYGEIEILSVDDTAYLFGSMIEVIDGV